MLSSSKHMNMLSQYRFSCLYDSDDIIDLKKIVIEIPTLPTRSVISINFPLIYRMFPPYCHLIRPQPCMRFVVYVFRGQLKNFDEALFVFHVLFIYLICNRHAIAINLSFQLALFIFFPTDGQGPDYEDNPFP